MTSDGSVSRKPDEYQLDRAFTMLCCRLMIPRFLPERISYVQVASIIRVRRRKLTTFKTEDGENILDTCLVGCLQTFTGS